MVREKNALGERQTETRKARQRSVLIREGKAFRVMVVLSLLALSILTAGEIRAASLIKPGREVPKFDLPLTAGGMWRLHQELGKTPLLLLYWSLYCDECREDMPKIQKIVDRLSSSKVKAVAINGDGKDAKKMVEGYWKQQNLTVISLMDEEIQDKFLAEGILGVERTPAAIVVNSKGIVLFAQEGKINLNALEEAIRKGN